MEPLEVNQLVTVSTGGPPVDAIVVDLPNEHKVVVALVDPKRGPVFRTFDADAVSERDAEGKQDPALYALIRRTPATGRGGSGGGAAAVQGRRGHGRSTMHRTTGK